MNPALISRKKKEEFLKGLNESEFRDKVVRPMLAMSGMKDGRDLCGPEEHGRDAIFFDKGPLGSDLLCAIQTKIGNLNLGSKHSTNIANIITQLRTALQTNYTVLHPQKSQRKPNIVFLIASGKINEHARKHIASEISESAIHFMDVDDIITRIDDHLPQLWLDLDVDVLTYLSEIEKQLIGNDGPFSAQFLPKDKASGEICFNEKAVTVFVRRSGKDILNKDTESDAFPLSEIPTKQFRKSLLLGEGGNGKTTGLLQIVYHSAHHAIQNGKIDYIPVITKATDIANSNDDLLTYLENKTKELTLQKNKSAFGYADLVSGKVCVYVDGLDEVPNQDQREKVLALIHNFTERFPNSLVALTSRPYEFLSSLDHLGEFERFFLLPLTWRGAEQILENVRGRNDDFNLPIVKESIKNLAQIQGFTLSPLMVSLYASTTQFDLNDIPPNITELFKRFTEQMLGRWDEQKGLSSLTRPQVKDFSLCCLGHEMQLRRITEIDEQVAESIIRDKLTATGHSTDSRVMFDEILNRSGLLRKVNNKISFRHHMFQEFFAGRGIENSEFIEEHVSDQWWRRPIVFYFGENPKFVNILTAIVSRQKPDEPKSQFASSCTIALALQACYLSSVDEKITTWKKALVSLAEVKPKFFSDEDDISNLPLLSDITYYFLCRESISLSNVLDQIEGILDWASSQEKSLALLPTLVYLSLMRMGRFDLVSAAQLSYLKTHDAWLAISMIETYEAINYRPLSRYQIDKAKSLRKFIVRNFDPVKHTMANEYHTFLERYKAKQDQIASETLRIE